MKKRLLKFLAVGVFTAAAMTGLKVFETRSRTIQVSYQAPAGALTATFRTPEGELLRRVQLSAGAERLHEIELADGPLSVELRTPIEARIVQVRVSPETTSLQVDWGRP